ncbi:MAG: glycoprotease [Campylobacteraceae bacterium]|nr:glycoprotease [Campylobacteraceae bacterium]
MVGVYFDNRLIDELISSDDEKASEFLVEATDKLLQKYEIQEIIYANGPGSFMGIKVAYIIFQTLSIALKIPFHSVSGFDLNGKKPIQANKHLSFVLDDAGKITLKKSKGESFALPLDISNLNISSDILPNYVIDAI